MNPMDLSVVVPVYNEVEIIAETIQRICHKLEGEVLGYELIIVNDGSTDGTREKIGEIKKKLEFEESSGLVDRVRTILTGDNKDTDER